MVTMEDVYLGLKKSANLPFTIVEKLVVVMGEVDIGIRTSNIPTVIRVILVDCLVYLFMVMI